MDSIIRIISAMIVAFVVFINVLGNLFGVGDLIPTQPAESSETTFADEIPTHTTEFKPEKPEVTSTAAKSTTAAYEESTHKPAVSTTKPHTTTKPAESDSQRIITGGKYVCFGWSAEKIVAVSGEPTEIFSDTTKDGVQLTTLVYASDYSKFTVYQIADDAFSGFYTVDKSAVVTDGVKSYSIASSGETAQSKLDVDEFSDSYNENSVYAIYVAYNNFYVMADDFTSHENLNKLNFYVTNAVRAINGVYAYEHSDKAEKAIKLHCIDMAERDYFSHVSPEGDSVGERLHAQGVNYRACAENIGCGIGNAFTFVDAWYNSKTGHRDALLSTTYVYMGGAFAVSADGTTYTGQNFYKSL